MKKETYIPAAPLDINEEFKRLKEKALAIIQDHSDAEWTNMNMNDPGVNVVELVCYGLAELDCCIDLPVADILAEPGDKLSIKDQFFLPEKILTTSPVTIEDYRKYLIDGIEEIKNVIIIADIKSAGNVYNVYLFFDESINDTKKIKEICETAFYYLNQSRNLGELFNMPIILIPQQFLAWGSIELEDVVVGKDAIAFLNELKQLIRTYIFPEVEPVGYNESTRNGISPNEIFNGPLLKTGWLPGNLTGTKRDKINSIELEEIIRNIPGVINVNIGGYSLPNETEITGIISTSIDQLITIDLVQSITKGSLKIYPMLSSFSADPVLNDQLLNGDLNRSGEFKHNIEPGASVCVQTSLPEVKYMDIIKYSSIQNTFHGITADGEKEDPGAVTSIQPIKSKQLIGYLALFDQVLANQHAQIANLNRLFSFKNTSAILINHHLTPGILKDESGRANAHFPSPFEDFSPTYFYQPLYDVPNIEPLLKDNDIFNFGLDVGSEKELEQKSWELYKKDPYNSYISGLMKMVEDEKTCLTRRNDILDHLLARHGESPLLFNSLIDGLSYSGNNLKDQVIIKSNYLQNLELLSYYRMKGYDYMRACKIDDILSAILEKPGYNFANRVDTDLSSNPQSIDEPGKLEKEDFINFSGLELKLNLLFGLKQLYMDHISNNYNDPGSSEKEEYRIALWMIEQRRGFIMLENNLLQYFLQPGGQPENWKADSNTMQATSNEITLIFPEFINEIRNERFKTRLDLFLQNSIPVHILYNILYLSSDQLMNFIPAFIKWHNDLLYKEENSMNNNDLKENANILATLLNKIIQEDPE
jgi:hypothetical protein